MRILPLFFSVFLVFGILSCGSDQEMMEPEYKDLCIVTGVAFSDPNGNPIGQAGNPNNRSSEVLFFPNPSDGNLIIQSLEIMNKVWIVPAEISTSFQEIDYSSEDYQYEENELNDKQQDRFDVSATSIALDLSQYVPGFYRIFVRTQSGLLQWENFYFDSSLSGNEILQLLLNQWP